MATRIMPVKIWNRGRDIAANGNVQIDYIDNVMQEVEATVYGTNPYGVSVNAVDPDADFCECPFFPDNGYCKHIAAVIKLLKTQKRPIESLFNHNTDDLHFADLFPEEYLDISAEFEAKLEANPQIAGTFYLDKRRYDELRASPEAWNNYFNGKKTIDKLMQAKAILSDHSLLHKAADKPNGNDFLLDLELPEHQYFQPLDKVTATALRLEVTLFIDEISMGWQIPEQRLMIELRIADQVDNKFYVVSDIDAFLAVYARSADYQTGGKRRFKLSHKAFAEPEQQLLDVLTAVDNEMTRSDTNYYGGRKNKCYLLNNYSFQQILPTLSQLTDFRFISPEKKQVYKQIELHDFQPDNGLLVGHLITVEDGYDLTIERNFSVTLDNNNYLIQDNNFYATNSEQMRIIIQIVNGYQQTLSDYSAYYTPATALHFPQNASARLNDFVAYFREVGVIELPAQLTVQQMTPHFDISKSQQTLRLALAYEYAGEVIDSNVIKQRSDISRDLEKEVQAQQYLESLGFQQVVGRIWVKSFKDSNILYRFFVEELPNLRVNGVVTVSDDLQAMLQDSAELGPEIDVAEADGFLAVNFSFAGLAENEVDQVLDQLDVERPFIERGDGSIVVLDDKLKKISTALAKIRAQGKVKHGQIKMHASQALAVQAALGTTANFDEKFQRLTTNLAHPEKFKVAKSRPVNAILRPYQKVGVKWLEMLDSYHFGGILADEMGLGKTLQMISLINNHLTADKVSLIVSPASLIYNWREEFAKFAPDVTVAVVDGTKAQRRELIATSSVSVLITSYNSARLDTPEYKKRQLQYLVLDEAQYVKNGNTKTNQNLRELTPQNTFALSGTPIENSAEELWSIFALVMPGLLPSKKAFNKLAPAEIAARVKPFILRREKSAVLKDLPPKVESNLYNEMTKEQKLVYLAQLKQMQVKVKGMSSESFVKNKIAILAGLTRLRQICDTPALYVEDYKHDSGKLEQLKEILNQARDNQHRVLVFSQFTSMLDLIDQDLSRQNVSTFMLQGNTKPKERLAMVDAFNAGEKDVFLISLKAGGTGLNLTGADTVILVDLWWNPAVEDQATGRAHRIGQKKKVEVYRLITKGTIEEQIYKLQEKKRNFVDQVLSGTENKGSLTEEEVKSILGIE